MLKSDRVYTSLLEWHILFLAVSVGIGSLLALQGVFSFLGRLEGLF